MAEALPKYPDSDFSDEELSPLDETFNQATDRLKHSIRNCKLGDSLLLQLYGLYKQGVDGRCNIPKPSWLDSKGRKKWEAWKKVGDLTRDQAKEQYIALLEKADPQWSKQSCVGTKETWTAVSSLRHSPEPELAQNEMTLLDAARENCHERVTELLKENPKLKYEKDEDGLTALHWATDRDATDALQAALDGGCPVDAVDDSGQTALHYAASCGHVKSTKLLIIAGASLIRDEEGLNPIDVAENDEIRKMLEDINELD